MSSSHSIPVVIVGAGGTGLCAALALTDAGVEALVLERDVTPLGSTAMSTGLIPAAGTLEQTAAGIDDSPDRFVADILAKTKGRTDAAMALRLAQESADTITWLRDRHGIPLTLADSWLYPGHSAKRMYGTPNRAGSELMGALHAAADTAGCMIVTQATATEVVSEGDRVTSVTMRRPDGATESVSCCALILASSGFGGNAAEVARWIPEMASAIYHGHPGNKGDAVRWGKALGAAVADMSAYQGHGGLAVGHGIPILWPLIMEGGFQVNRDGRRFSNEALGYSEQAEKIIAQPDGFAWSIFDERRHLLMMEFQDYQVAVEAGVIVRANTVADLATRTRLPIAPLDDTIASVEGFTNGDDDDYGRDFTGKAPLRAPYYAAKVTGALFHTQGGLVVDGEARVLRPDGTPLPNLFAGGGAARGISGIGADGYLAGNGLLTATTLGKLAGRAAARLVQAL